MTHTPELIELGMSRTAVNKLTAELKRLEAINADLLAALRAVANSYEHEYEPYYMVRDDTMKQVRAAIAKATGE